MPHLVSLEELLAAFVERYPELRCSREACLDHRLPSAWSHSMAKWSRLDEAQIHASLGSIFASVVFTRRAFVTRCPEHFGRVVLGWRR